MTELSPRLRAYRDLVWTPAGADVRLGTSRDTADADEAYLVLPHPAKPRLLVADVDPKLIRQMLLSYRGLRGRLTSLQLHCLGVVSASSPISRRLPRLLVHHGPGRTTVGGQDSGRGLVGDVRAALADESRPPSGTLITLRDQSVVTKPTLSFFGADGRPLGYAKAGVSAGTDTMVRNETRALSEVQSWLQQPGQTDAVPPSDLFDTPKPLRSFSWLGHPVLVTEPMPLSIRRERRAPHEMVDVLNALAASGDRGSVPWELTDVGSAMPALLVAARAVDPEAALRLGGIWNRLREHGRLVAIGRSHGDWVNWNVGRAEGRTIAWDWESSRRRVPLGFDALHWHFQVAMAARGPEAAVAATQAQVTRLAPYGVEPRDSRAVVTGYLVERLAQQVVKLGTVDEALARSIDSVRP